MNTKQNIRPKSAAQLSLMMLLCVVFAQQAVHAQAPLEAAVEGKLGVGTATPEVPLHVWGGNAGTDPDWIEGADQMIIEDNNWAILQLFTGTAGQGWLEFSDTTRARGAIGYRHSYDHLVFYTTGGQKMSIEADGRIKMPYVYGDPVTGLDLRISSDGTLGVPVSSIRYKENVRDVQDADTDWIYALRPRVFDFKAPLTGTNQCGLIAEEVERVAPQIVSYKRKLTYPEPTAGVWAEDSEPIITTTNEPQSVSYSALTVPMLAEIQKLKAQIDALERRVAEFEADK